MKAQHPPHVPSHTPAVTERFRSPCFSGKAAGAAARRWWHHGGHQLRRPQCVSPIYRQQKTQEKVRITWTNLEVGDLKRIFASARLTLKTQISCSVKFHSGKKRTIAEKVTGLQFSRQPEYSWWEYLSGQSTFIYALFNLTEVSTVSLRRRHDYFTQWEEGKQPLSWVNLFYNRKHCWFMPPNQKA